MHTTASSLVAIAQYFWRIRTPLFFVYQQKFNIEAVNDYPPIRIRIVAADSIRDSIQTEIRRSLHLSFVTVCTMCINCEMEYGFQSKFCAILWSEFHEIWFVCWNMQVATNDFLQCFHIMFTAHKMWWWWFFSKCMKLVAVVDL